jgi:TM2 domain-containing membrane protein YozV
VAVEKVFCQACGEGMSAAAQACPKCGHPSAAVAVTTYPQQQQLVSGPPKSRIVAGVLGLLLGGLGVHKFYLGNVGLGIVYLIFFWTFIPAIIGFIEGIIYLVQSDEEFGYKQGVTVQRS